MQINENNINSSNEQQNNITGNVTNVVNTISLTFNANANPNATSSDPGIHPTTDTSPHTTNTGRSFIHNAITGVTASRTDRHNRSHLNGNIRRGQILSFNSQLFSDHYDKRECSNIYTSISTAVSIMDDICMVDDIVKQIAEYATGMVHSCLGCNQDVMILNSNIQSTGLYYDPNRVIQPQGKYDVNSDVITYCRGCEMRSVQCAYFINKNTYGYMINNGLDFTNLFCSFRFIPIYNERKCAKCLGGARSLMIGGKMIQISCTHSRNSYSHSNSNVNIGSGNNTDCQIM